MKKILSLVLALSLLVSMCVFTGVSVSAEGEQWNGEAAADFSGGGDGSPDNPYKIGTAAELKLFANKVNAGETGICGILTADIVLNVGDVSGCNGTKADGWYDWSPIGPYSTPYAGAFNGGGHTVSGVYFNNTSIQGVGLFGRINSDASISNLGIVNSYLKGMMDVGGVCGYNGGTITDCYNTGTVSCSLKQVGGVCGRNSIGTISNCYNTGTVSGNTNVGGVCGRNSSGKITGCYNIGLVSGNSMVGGVCGYNGSTVTNCYYLEGTAQGGIDSADATGSAESETEEYMKSQDFVDLLNTSEGVNFVFYGGYPAQSWEPEPVQPEPEYTVTIPAEVALGQSCPVSVDVTVLPTGKQVAVTLTGTSGADNAFTMQTADGASLTYTVSNGANPVSMGDKILAANAVGNAETSLVFNAPETVQFAGTYTGTVTFTVSVADAN